VGEQQTLKPAVEQLNEQLKKLGTPDAFQIAKFTADSGFHSEKTWLTWQQQDLIAISLTMLFEAETRNFKSVKLTKLNKIK
jgi:hypothetical protein